MTTPNQPMQITVRSQRLDNLTANMQARTWTTTLAITGQQPIDEPKPTEAIIGALAACMIAGIQRESEVAGLQIDDVQVSATGTRVIQESGPLLTDLNVQVNVTSPEPEEKIRPLLEALQHNGTVTNTLKLGQPVSIEYQISSSKNKSL